MLVDDIGAHYYTVLCGAIIAFGLGEILLPRRTGARGLAARWSSNIGLAVTNAILVRLAAPAGLIEIAFIAERQGWGLLNVIAAPPPVLAALAVLGLDLGKYVEHRLLHAVPLLWRLHMVHHADPQIDLTSGYRHHPLEAFVAYAFAALTIVVLGPPAVAVALYLLMAMVAALYTHANIRFAPRLDRALRRVVVTRDAHAVHHSAVQAETDSNYGHVFLWWDRLFGTYRAAPAGGLDGYTIGLAECRAGRDQWLDRVLAMPFRPNGRAAAVPRDAVG